MIAHCINVDCPRSFIVKKYYYYIVHIKGKELPFPTGCETCVDISPICQNCTSAVINALVQSWENGTYISEPLKTGLDTFSGPLQEPNP